MVVQLELAPRLRGVKLRSRSSRVEQAASFRHGERSLRMVSSEGRGLTASLLRR
jgi:hypothetical protein